MKKLIIAVFAAVILMSCDRTPKPQLSAVIYHDSIVQPLTEGSRFSMSTMFDINYFTSANKPELAQKINSTLISTLFGNELAGKFDSIPEACSEFRKLLFENYVADNEDAKEGIDEDEFDFTHNYEYETLGYVVYENASRLSYCIERYTYLGGVHGVNTRQFINFSLPNGEVLTQDSLLQGDYREPLHLLMLKSIIEDDNDVALVKEVEEKGYFVNEIYPNNNFYLTDSSMVYVFNPYEIGPYAFGDVEIELSFSELDGYLR